MTKARDIADNAGQGGGASNVIINGAMKISQRATSLTGITSSGYKTVDRWRTSLGSAGTWTQTQNAVTDLAGFRYSLKMACTTANASLGASSSLNVNTRLEGFDIQQFQKGTASAKKWAMSFYVKASKTGTYIVELFDNNNNRHVNKSYTINAANTWEHKKIIFDGDTSSPFANTNGNCLIVSWFLAAGSDKTSGTLQETWGALTHANRCVGQVNLADSTSNTWEITGVQLEVGDKATDFEHRTFADELARCQRYYTQTYDYGVFVGHSGDDYDGTMVMRSLSSTVSNQLGEPLPTRMRSMPTVTFYGPTPATNTAGKIRGSGNGVISATLGGNSSERIVTVSFTSNQSNSYISAHYTADAEL